MKGVPLWIRDDCPECEGNGGWIHQPDFWEVCWRCKGRGEVKVINAEAAPR